MACKLISFQHPLKEQQDVWQKIWMNPDLLLMELPAQTVWYFRTVDNQYILLINDGWKSLELILDITKSTLVEMPV